ncbi:hypothetical protein A11A3_12163 [Alcanivorax hongdengensis A-11-3]|uniref:YtxH domain-containing protein n=1 Tax=Alcanivorax hongdengensis A-11-3 TaxID=1177179 RepID=L0WC91_9GAMM|nr:hypothetical protein [Alcanivorax hongdengensis]EKF73717.1 hypothetical protein A11A3_12163 [Alcanivorax hongdengensis A-11-3]
MRTFGKAMLISLFATGAVLAGCDSNDGPAEKAGEKIDKTVEKMTPDTQGPMEEMGEDMDNAYDNAKESAEDMKDAAEN